jgi:predicted GNAT superfamily acetyltransferase
LSPIATSSGDTPWELAERAAKEAGVEIRPLTSLEDGLEIQRVMGETWGDQHLLSREVIRALQASGNVPLGAFEEDRLIGYVLGFLGHQGERVHLHSHMLAVSTARRSGGVGFALKLAQRAAALDAGVTVVRWTFDPLVARNAYLNLSKLGAVADRFGRNYYGDMPDLLNEGDRSDRLEARWDLLREPGPRPAPEDAVLVRIPSDHAELRARDPEDAARLRDEVAAQLELCLADGLVATGFLREGAYLFTPEPGR